MCESDKCIECIKEEQSVNPFQTVEFQKKQDLEKALNIIIEAKIEGWECVKSLDDVDMMRVESALTNKIYRCQKKVNPNHQSPLLLRIYGGGTEIMFDRKDEVALFKELSDQKFGVTFIKSVPNGRIEEWKDGYEPISTESLYSLESRQKIAEQLSEMHKVVVPGAKREDVYIRCHNWLNGIKQYCKGERYNSLLISNIEKELDSIINIIQEDEEKNKQQNIHYDYVCGHTDLHRGNILQNKEGKIQIIDFEYSIYTTAPLDISFVFFDWMLDYSKPDHHNLLEDSFPSFEEQRDFLAHYLYCYYGKEPSEEYIQQYMILIQKYLCLCVYMWMLWGYLESAISEIDYDFFNYANDRADFYREQKLKAFQLSSLQLHL
ncbi:hypothetical protein WA158_003585 [Blastocystis sp. Blastoise]